MNRDRLGIAFELLSLIEDKQRYSVLINQKSPFQIRRGLFDFIYFLGSIQISKSSFVPARGMTNLRRLDLRKDAK